MGYRVLVSFLALVMLVVFARCTNRASNPPGGAGPSQGTSAIRNGDVIRAVIAGNRERVRELVAKGADINENVGDSENAVTPLMAAILNRRTDIALDLIDQGAALYPTYEGYSAHAFALGILGDHDPISIALRRRQP